jgi:ATP-dependent Lhr-like helicase
MAQSGEQGRPGIARAHHGSVSKEQRALIEDDLKAGGCRASSRPAASSSASTWGGRPGRPGRVAASGRQRPAAVGRRGHQVGEVIRGVLFPKHRGDLCRPRSWSSGCARRDRGAACRHNPLDVLAQQIVAAGASTTWTSTSCSTLAARPLRSRRSRARPRRHASTARRALPVRRVRRAAARDRSGTVSRHAHRAPGRPAARGDLGGTIPDRGLFGVFLVGEKGRRSRVGELDEEMVYESRVGDVFALGPAAGGSRTSPTTGARHPAPGQPGRLPFWKGDALGRPASSGARSARSPANGQARPRPVGRAGARGRP